MQRTYSALTGNLCGERGEQRTDSQFGKLLFITWILFLVSPWPQMVRTTATDEAAKRYKARVVRELEAVELKVAVQNCVNYLVNGVVAIESAELKARVISAGVVSASSRHMHQLDFSKPLVEQLNVVQHIPGLDHLNAHLPSQGVPALSHGGPSFRGQNASQRLGTELRPHPVKRKADSRGEPTRRSQRSAGCPPLALRSMQPVVYTKPSTQEQLVVLFVCLDNSVPVFLEMDTVRDHGQYVEVTGSVNASLDPLMPDASDEHMISLFKRCTRRDTKLRCGILWIWRTCGALAACRLHSQAHGWAHASAY
jgi:hypothetical protein